MSEPNIVYTKESGVSITFGPVTIIHFIISILTLGITVGYIRGDVTSALKRLDGVESELKSSGKERIDILQSLSVIQTEVRMIGNEIKDLKRRRAEAIE